MIISIKKRANITFAHDLWKKHLKPKDNVIDATCGNGYDSIFLKSLQTNGKLFCIDIQEKAIQNTKSLFKKNNISLENTFFFNKSHENFSYIPKEEIKLIVYNLGYLPGSNKEIITNVDTTIKSILSSLDIVKNGAISITCYPHMEGKKEEKEILDLLSKIKNRNIIHSKWEHFRWGENSPSIIWITKIT